MIHTAFVLAFVVLISALLAPLARLLFLSRRKKSSTEKLSLVGRLASVERALSPEGTVLVDGDLWRARSRSGESVARGRDNVRVTGARGHLLEVEPV